MSVPPEVIAAIRGAPRVLLATHNPMDGDGLGSGLALRRALLALGHECEFWTESHLPRVLTFVPGHDEIRRLGPDDAPPDADLLVGLDAGEASRLGRLYAERRPGMPVVNIDHHVSNTRYADVDWVDPEAAATGEMVHPLLAALGWEMDGAAALALLVALVTDTGRFCYSSTTPRTFETAAQLVRAGASPDLIQRHLYASVPRQVLQLRARAAEAMTLHAGGRVAVLTVPPDFLNAREDDIKDLVDIVISVEGVLVAALVRGLEDGTTKVSLRSKDDRADVARLAGEFGGGGHVRASGFSRAEGPQATEKALLPALERLAVSASE